LRVHDLTVFGII